ncbi:MAG: sigma 54-interacting transcriptional regulator, partial [Planctomycetota bacterium]|nr:sigma 54-interacting transcriptional regulator [Planctomycetota bacterium]
MPLLRIVEPGQTRTHSIADDLTTIGRGAANTIQILDIKASREHCRIERAERGGYKLIDLESQNGTLINGAKVNQQLLRHGDKIEIGSTAIYVEREPSDRVDPRGFFTPEPAARPRPLAIRRRRSYPFRPRRVLHPTPTTPQAKEQPTIEDRLGALIDEAIRSTDAMTALDTIADLLDEYFIEKTGDVRSASLLMARDKYKKLQEISQALNSEHDLPRLLDTIMDAAVGITGAERGFLILAEGGSFNFKVARNFGGEPVKNPAYEISRSIADEVVKTSVPIVTANAQEDERLSSFVSVSDLKLRSVLCAPFKSKGRVTGCIYLDNPFEEAIFTEVELDVLTTLGDHAAIAIENARLLAENIRQKEELRIAKDRLEKKVELQSEEIAEKEAELKEKREALVTKYSYANIVGQSAALQNVFRTLDRITASDFPVIIEGESGTGKELIARALHFNGPRGKYRFVSENCAAISETLLESELFGHKRGSFTGANQDRKGLFEMAHQGTLFLDEIGNMSLEMQKKLLRAIQEGEIRPVGGKNTIKVDVRIVSASNQNLRELVARGQFREDLFYRINVVRIVLPPLRERKEDIPLLVERFLHNIAHEADQPPKKISREAMRNLLEYDWPGNVRELENEMRRAVALSEDIILPDALGEEVRSGVKLHGRPTRAAEASPARAGSGTLPSAP